VQEHLPDQRKKIRSGKKGKKNSIWISRRENQSDENPVQVKKSRGPGPMKEKGGSLIHSHFGKGRFFRGGKDFPTQPNLVWGKDRRNFWKGGKERGKESPAEEIAWPT